MKSLIIILVGLYASWHYTELSSESPIYSCLAPFGVLVFLISLGFWLVLKGSIGGRSDGCSGYHGGEGGFGGDGGCD